MKNKSILMVVIFCVILGGCKMRSDQVDESKKLEDDKYYIPVQEYTGKEYPANEKKERWEYIEENREGIEAAAIGWFMNKYNFDVKVNHIYPRNGALIAIVEWLNDSDLKMPIVMGYNENSKKITGLQLTAMQLDNTIMSYLVYKVYEAEFSKLDSFLANFCGDNNLYAYTDAYIKNSGNFAGFKSNYYYIGAASLDFEETYKKFIENPAISIDELKVTFSGELEKIKGERKQLGEDISNPNIVFSLYCSNDKIDKTMFGKLEENFLLQTYLPDLNYSFTINENSVDTRTGRANNVSYPSAPTETGYLKIKGNK